MEIMGYIFLINSLPRYGKPLRTLISVKIKIYIELVHFGDQQVFDNATLIPFIVFE